GRGRAGGPDRGGRPGPAGQRRVAGGGVERGGVEQTVGRGGGGGDQDQSLGDVALLEREQARDRGPRERIAAQAPDAFGGVGEQPARAQHGHRPLDIAAFEHRGSLAQSMRRAPAPAAAQHGAASVFFTTRFLPGSKRAAVTSGRAGSTSPEGGRAAFFAVAFFAAFFAVDAFAAAFFAGAFLVAAFFAAAFFAPKPRRAGLPVSS